MRAPHCRRLSILMKKCHRSRSVAITFSIRSPRGDGGTCGLTAAGAAFCWGLLGAGILYDSAGIELPVPAGSGESFTALAVGGLFICGLHAGGSASCWGNGSSGALGDGGPPVSRRRRSPSPAGRPSPRSVQAECTSAVSPGQEQPIAGERTRVARSVMETSTGTPAFTPVPVAGGLTFASIAAGVNRTCALTPAGAAYCWGLTFVNEPETPTDNQCLTLAARQHSVLFPLPHAAGAGVRRSHLYPDRSRRCRGVRTDGGRDRVLLGRCLLGSEAIGVPTALPNGIPFATLGIGNALHACGEARMASSIALAVMLTSSPACLMGPRRCPR